MPEILPFTFGRISGIILVEVIDMDIEQELLRFCNNVRARRLALGLSLPELAARSGVSQRCLRTLEGNVLPRRLMLSQVAGLARALGCQPYELFQ